MSKWESCGGCSGGCGGCSGCGLELELTEEEIGFLRRLGECAFLPVIREAEAPVFPEEPGKELLLQCLEKKGLISLDYDKPEGVSYPRLRRQPRPGQHGADQAGTGRPGADGISGRPQLTVRRPSPEKRDIEKCYL